MNQVHSGNYQHYQPSYNTYKPQTAPQWSNSFCQRQPAHQNYYGRNTPSCETYSSCCDNSNTCQASCMGRCNPPKLYSETYSYLSENLMRPVIEEVYQDLKSITSANTVANNSMATKIGLPNQGQTNQAPVNPMGNFGRPTNQGLVQQNSQAMTGDVMNARMGAQARLQHNSPMSFV